MYKAVVGLRSATKEEIVALIEKYKGEGYKVTHKTKDNRGKNLPCNGVLLLS